MVRGRPFGRHHPVQEAAIEILFRIAGHDGLVGPGHHLWQAPLPTIRRPPAPAIHGAPAAPAAITHADYFEALRTYLTGPGRRHAQRAMAAHLPDHQGPLHPDRIVVTLEKHGEFYHPARLAVDVKGAVFSLALNVAANSIGIEWMASEIEALSAVVERLPANSVPVMYGHAVLPLAGRPPLHVFMADWFDGFHEFHLSIDPRSGRQAMVVWDTSAGPFFLSEQQQVEVYRQAAYLLTRAYDPATSRQIYPWHHASGDFVLRANGEAMALRLITVRQYAPTIGGGDGGLDDEGCVMGLLVFFLNLTLRNRLDRLDGTGKPAWAGPFAVPATVKGGFEALAPDRRAALRALLESYSARELIDVLGAVAERYRLMPSEMGLIHAELEPHANLLLDTLRGLP